MFDEVIFPEVPSTNKIPNNSIKRQKIDNALPTKVKVRRKDAYSRMKIKMLSRLPEQLEQMEY